MKSNVYSIQELHKAPSSPGLYGWYIRIRDYSDIQEYHSFFKSSSMKATIEGNLKDVYSGRVNQERYDFEKDIKNNNILKKSVITFGVPVYIGISMNLERRLNEHVKLLNDCIYSNKDFDVEGEIKLDTEEESKHFAQRIAAHLDSLSTIGTNCLFVRTVEVGEEVSFCDLHKVEKFINRTFVPSFGLK